nr:hypothetical protein [Tanacetum cinerariifolium]
MYMAKIQEVSPKAVDSGPIFDIEPEQKIDQNDEDADLAEERELLASLIEKLKCEIDEIKNRNKFLETSNKVLIDKLKSEIKDFRNKNNSLELSNNQFKEANNKLSEENDLLYADFKKSQAELKPRDSIEYASEMKLECAKVRAPESDEVIRLEKESRSKLSDLIRPFDYTKLNNLYDLFVPQREKLTEQRYFSERSRMSHIHVQNEKKESFNKQTTLLEKRMDESIPLNKNCKSSFKIVKIKTNINTIITGVELCKQKIANRTYIGYIDPFIKNTIEQKFCPVISRINVGLDLFLKCLNEEMVVDLRYFNSLELEVNSLTSQLETQRTQFVNEIDRLSMEYYYADHMHVILGVYTELVKVTNLQCDYLELLEKCEGLETELSKSKMMSKSFESVQKHAINLELELQQCKEKIKNDMSFKVNKSKDFCKERKQYFEIQDLKAQLQDKGIVISELKKLMEKQNGKSVDTKFEKSLVIRQPNTFKSQRPSVLRKLTTFPNSFVRKDFSKSTSVTQTHVSNDFSKPVTTQILPANKKSILKNTNVLNPGM